MPTDRAPSTQPPGRGNPSRARAPLGILTVLALLTAGIIALAGPAAPASAHGDEVLLKVTAATPQPGEAATVTAVAAFLDGDKAAGVPLTAVATGPAKKVSVRLKASGPRGTYTGRLRLAPGRWKVTVTAGGEHTGRGTATVTVPAPPNTTAAPATTVAPATTAPGTSLAAQPAAASTPGRGGLPVALAAVAAVVVAGGLTLAVTRQRRRPRSGA